MNIGIVVAIAGASALLAAFIVFIVYRSQIGSLKNYKFDLMESSRKEGETLKKELILEGKDEAIRIKQKSEDEYNEKLRDLRNSERELQKREGNLERKIESVDQRYDSLQKYDQDLKKKDQEINVREKEIEKLIDEQQSKLEKIAGLSREEAKQTLKDSLYEKARVEAQVKVKDIKEAAILNANKEAKKIIIEADPRTPVLG
jgi:ribonucrease Y